MEQRNGGILITGGTGFLGRAIVRELLANPAGEHRICIYSRNEHSQAAMFEDFGRHPRLRMFIGDVRDRERLYWAMRSVSHVIHAAALKRIEVGHYNPTEMVRTNIEGAMNVVAAAIAADVHRAVLVSTDKAYHPVSPYGISKAMAEAVFQASNNTVATGGPTFGVCRYGNVAGSTGSVIPVWRAALAAGRPVQMRDPTCTRFWMTATEAVEVVLATLHGTEQLRIPQLKAFLLADLAHAMDADVELTSLARWEKKHESLQDGQSSDTAPRMTVDELREALKHV